MHQNGKTWISAKVFLAILFSFLLVVWGESVAAGDLLKAPKTGIGAVSDTVGIADSALPGNVGFWQRWSVLRGAKKEFGATPKIRYGQLKDEFVPGTNTINLTGSRFGKHRRGTFFEEVQHAIDDVLKGKGGHSNSRMGVSLNARGFLSFCLD